MMRRLFWLLPGAILALLTFLPLSWVGSVALPASLTTAETSFRGTIWRGSVHNLRDVESVTYALRPLKIFGPGLPVEAELAATGLRANLEASRHQAANLRLQINVANLPLPDPRLRGLAGQISAVIDDVSWTETAQCKSIAGTASTDVLTRNKALFSWEGPRLSGPVSCSDEGDYVFELQGQDPRQTISATVSISAGGQYKSDIAVITRDDEAALVLPLFGFEERGETSNGMEFRLVEQGQWR